MSSHIAVDVGGTQMRAACFPQDQLKPLVVNRISTRHPSETPLERLHRVIASVWPQDGDVAAIAVAAPGPLDPYHGVILAAPNIPGWINVPLRQDLEQHFNVPVALGNDANMATLGEWMYGAGKGHHHVLYFTISTGIGGGAIIDDRLLLGAQGMATEVGHVTIDQNGPLCGCGQRGHLEALASGTAIAAWVKQEIEQGAETSLPKDRPVDARMVAEAARAGDALSKKAMDRAGRYLGQGIASYLHIFNPSIVIIGGGVSRAGELLFEPMRKALHEYVITPRYLENLTLTTAAFGDDAGLMGALALARSTGLKVADKVK